MRRLQQLARRRQRETAVVAFLEHAAGDEKAEDAAQRRRVYAEARGEIVRGARAERELVRNAELRRDVDGLCAQPTADEMAHRRLRGGVESGAQHSLTTILAARMSSP